MEDEVEKRQTLTWKIMDFNYETVARYKTLKSVKSEKFEVFLGNNRTEWILVFYPKLEEFCEVYLKKLACDRNDFIVKAKIFAQKSDGEKINKGTIVRMANEFNKSSGHSWGFRRFLCTPDLLNHDDEILFDETLTLVIHLELIQEGPSAKKPRLDSNDWTVKYFNSNALSDVSIISSDEKMIPAHRCILAGRSSVFENKFPTQMTTAGTNIIVDNEIDGDTMLEFLRYIYTLEVQNLSKHASKLLICAKKYDMTDLKTICVQELIYQLSDENIFENLLLAKFYGERYLMIKCMDYIAENFMNLKQSDEWKKIDNNFMIDIMQKVIENSKGITFINYL